MGVGRCGGRSPQYASRAFRRTTWRAAQTARGDRIAIAAYLGSSDAADTALARFAEAYADQNERDFTALRDAVTAGRVTAESDL